MKFIKTIPVLGDTREKSRFLIFPKTIREDVTWVTKWLQRAKWQEEYQSFKGGNFRWFATKFIK